MATSLSTLSHRLSIRPKPFPFSNPNRPNSLSFPILSPPSFSLLIFPSPSLSLTKIHCTPPEAEDNETFSEEEEEEEVDPIFLDAEEDEDDEEEEHDEEEEGTESEVFLDEEGNEVEWDVSKLLQFMEQEQGEGDSEPSATDILEFLKKKESEGDIDEEFLNQFLITKDSDESYEEEETETEGQQPSLSTEEADDGFTGPLFEDTEETEEEAAIDFELLYGPAFSGVSYLEGNDVDEMDSKLENVVDEYNNLITTKPVDDFEERVLEVKGGSENRELDSWDSDS